MDFIQISWTYILANIQVEKKIGTPK